jgi:hypothetical protein
MLTSTDSLLGKDDDDADADCFVDIGVDDVDDDAVAYNSNSNAIFVVLFCGRLDGTENPVQDS